MSYYLLCVLENWDWFDQSLAIHNVILALKSEDDDLDILNEAHIPDVMDLLPGEEYQENGNGRRKTREILLDRYY